MKLSELLASEKAGPVFRPLFKAQNGRLTAIHLLKGEVIKEHKSPVPAMLLVVEGVVVYKQLVDGWSTDSAHRNIPKSRSIQRTR